MLEFIIEYWVQIFLTFIYTLIVYIFKQYKGLKNGMKSLLRNEIVRMYEVYMKIGYCPSYMKENLSEIYVSYHQLNGNGMATSMIEELYKLPNQKKGK